MTTALPLLGKYQVLEETGRGGMGAVYKGYDPALDRTVAIKVLAPHLAWEKDFVERFLREARSAGRLQHPNIVPVYDVGQDGENYYFVMAYLPGLSLKELMSRQGRFPAAAALPILRQLAEALDYAHERGLVHRDVKPANVVFDGRGQAVLTDFGIAKAADETRLTATGGAIGTPQYMSPEQITGKAVDGRADQYALAIIAFEMLTGRVPFDAPSTTAIMYQQVNDPPPAAAGCAPGLPGQIDSVLGRALEKSPAARFGSCAEFAAGLERAFAAAAAAESGPMPAGAPGAVQAPYRPLGGPTILMNPAESGQATVQPVPPKAAAPPAAAPGRHPAAAAATPASTRVRVSVVVLLPALFVLQAIYSFAVAKFYQSGDYDRLSTLQLFIVLQTACYATLILSGMDFRSGLMALLGVGSYLAGFLGYLTGWWLAERSLSGFLDYPVIMLANVLVAALTALLLAAWARQVTAGKFSGINAGTSFLFAFGVVLLDFIGGAIVIRFVNELVILGAVAWAGVFEGLPARMAWMLGSLLLAWPAALAVRKLHAAIPNW